jgi:hypothetical protein
VISITKSGDFIMKRIGTLVIALVVSHIAGSAYAAISLTSPNFTADPPAEVTFSPDGSVATLTEEALFPFGTFLFNQPPPTGTNNNVIIPGPGLFLTFDWDFFEDVGHDDSFRAVLFDVSGPDLRDILVGTTSSGSESWDLTPYTGLTLGLEFQLLSNFPPFGTDPDLGGGTNVIVSNVEIVPIPEPTTFAVWSLLGLALTAACWWRRRR